jgi:hypothetical protein
MAKIKEAPEDLQRQKEDIENLLSSLDTAFKEGSITQEHFNEVKQKNAEKLEEVKKKLQQAERQAQKEAEKAQKAESPEPEPPAEPPVEPAPQTQQKEEKPKEAEKKEDKGILGGLATKITGEKEPGVDEERIKEKIIAELSPKMEKMNIRLVKLKAFVDALKEDKAGEREGTQRITEEVGETRSAMSSVESRLSEMELKLEDVSETLADLKPQRFAKELQKKEEEIKMHDARIEKLDDMSSTILKRVNQIQIILEKLGNIESIADMTKDLSKKMVSLDDKEKKITRLADKIDSMFVEINKRLEEFMFYKAKQDSLDDLSKEMLKSMDELTTKLTRYAEKDDLELLRDTLENKINTIIKESPAPAAERQGLQEKGEIESLMKLLDEQFKKGQMSKKDYEKAKQANVQKLKEMQGGAVRTASPQPPAEEEETEAAHQEPDTQEDMVGEQETQEPETPEPETPEPSQVESGLAQASRLAQPSEPIQAKAEKPAKKETPSRPEPAKKAKPSQDEHPEKSVTKEDIIKKISPPKEKPGQKKPLDKKQKMLADLEDSFRKGLLSQRAYETTQKIIMAKKF